MHGLAQIQIVMKIYTKLALLALSTIPLLLGACSLTGSNNRATHQPQVAQDSSQPRGQRERRGGRHIDFADAAKKLGVSEAELRKDLGLPADPSSASSEGDRPSGGSRHLDIQGAAAKLGVTKEQLIEALGLHPRKQSDSNQPHQSGDSQS